MSREIERVHRQRNHFATLSATHFENIEMAADHANPNEGRENAAEYMFDGTRLKIISRSLGHQYFSQQWQSAVPATRHSAPPAPTIAPPLLSHPGRRRPSIARLCGPSPGVQSGRRRLPGHEYRAK